MYDPSLHLFIDDVHIRNTFAMKREFFAPVKQEEPAFEDIAGRAVAWGCAMREVDGRFRCWYQSCVLGNVHEMAVAEVWGRGQDYGFYPERFDNACPEAQTSVLSYAESEDGFRWHKPELGLVDWRGSRANNILLDGTGAAAQFAGAVTGIDGPSVVRDEQAPETERYKLLAHMQTSHCFDNRLAKLDRPQADIDRFLTVRGKFLTTSPDGIHWQNPLQKIKECLGDYSGVVRDERNSRWWYNERPPVWPHIPFLRAAGLCVSDDLTRWPEVAEQVVAPGEYEEWGQRYENHGMTPFNYGDQDLGYLEISIKGFPVANVLLTHRDGGPWQRANGDAPLISLGQTGNYDELIVNATRNAPLVCGDQLVVLFNARSRGQADTSKFKGAMRGVMGLAVLRLDGFAGMVVDQPAAARHGSPAGLQTQPLAVTQDNLEINIEGHQGTAKVSLLDEGAVPIEGFEEEESLPAAEDGVRAPVRWREHANIKALRGRKVMVQVRLAAGTVYSVRL